MKEQCWRALPNGTVGQCVSVPVLTAEKLQETLAAVHASHLAYTQACWRDIATRHGPQITAVGTPAVIARLEAEMLLLPEGRPGWLRVTRYAPQEDALWFIRCGCLCHQASEAIPWPATRDCCHCTAKLGT